MNNFKTSSKLKMLIADDHRLFVDGLQHILKTELNIDATHSVSNGKEAIELFHKEKFDIVLMDINMPVLDGVYACKEIKRYAPATKVIFITMLCNYANASSALQAGADAFVYKGNSTEELLEALKEVKANKIFITESLRHFFTEGFRHDKPTREKYISFAENLISQREKEVLKLIVEGLTNEQIAEVLEIAVRTVSTHRNNLLAKLKLHNTAALVRFAIENKLV